MTTVPAHRSELIPFGANVRVRTGFYAGLRVPIEVPWLVVGRGFGADVLLAEPTLSRAHAALGFAGGAFFVQDLGSESRTRVNRATVQRCELQDGDFVQLGRLLVEVSLPGACGRLDGMSSGSGR